VCVRAYGRMETAMHIMTVLPFIDLSFLLAHPLEEGHEKETKKRETTTTKRESLP
jgi:hypothetical protein